jgi:hypothetical protein
MVSDWAMFDINMPEHGRKRKKMNSLNGSIGVKISKSFIVSYLKVRNTKLRAVLTST